MGLFDTADDKAARRRKEAAEAQKAANGGRVEGSKRDYNFCSRCSDYSKDKVTGVCMNVGMKH